MIRNAKILDGFNKNDITRLEDLRKCVFDHFCRRSKTFGNVSRIKDNDRKDFELDEDAENHSDLSDQPD